MSDNAPRTVIAARTADLREMLEYNLDEFEGITKDDAIVELLDAIDQADQENADFLTNVRTVIDGVLTNRFPDSGNALRGILVAMEVA